MVNFEPDARAGSGDKAPIRKRTVNFWQKPRFGLLARRCLRFAILSTDHDRWLTGLDMEIVSGVENQTFGRDRE